MGRSTEAQAGLERAVAALDRELAADLELTGMFDQTKQAFVLELGQWGIHASTIEREVPHLHVFLAETRRRGATLVLVTPMERRNNGDTR